MDDLTIKEGLTDAQIDQLVEFTNDDDTVKNLTADYRRFQNRQMAEDWIDEGNKIFYVLEDEGHNLKGIIWFAANPIRDTKYIVDFNPNKYQLTMAIRLYNDARGKGLAVPFFETVFKKLKESDFYQNIPNKGLWLGTHPENLPAINLYKKLGFIQVNNNEREINRVVMIKPD